jgi:hypothetical protein
VALNFSGEERQVNLPANGSFVDLFSQQSVNVSTGVAYPLQPWAFSVLSN